MCAWIAPSSSTMMGVTPGWPLLTNSRRKPPTSKPAPVSPTTLLPSRTWTLIHTLVVFSFRSGLTLMLYLAGDFSDA
ncbi:hypothetical protein D3C71_1196230 [compost metagenome]